MFVTNEFAELADGEAMNQELKAEGKECIQFEVLLLGIMNVAINRKSFLSAASFQQTTRTLIGAALRGTTDTLKGLKENVIIGRLIPAGTGFSGSTKHGIIAAFQAEKEKERAARIQEEELL
jgi:DNA-directed RNA polymerase subunit beta'